MLSLFRYNMEQAPFVALRRGCLAAAAEQRVATQTGRLPTPLSVLARHAGVEPADCAGCARPVCSPEHRPGGPPCCAQMLAEMLRVVSVWLERRNVKHFLTGGSLLGAMNDHSVHEWNEGASIAIDASSMGLLRELDAELLRQGVAYYVNQEHPGGAISTPFQPCSDPIRTPF